MAPISQPNAYSTPVIAAFFIIPTVIAPRSSSASVALRPPSLQRPAPSAPSSILPTAPLDLLADLLAGKHDVTALFSWNDIAAVEMLDALYAPDSPMPKGFSIIGFDDLPLAGMATPRLSTMAVDRESIGRGAVRLLDQHMDGEATVQQLETGVTTIAGETVFAI